MALKRHFGSRRSFPSTGESVGAFWGRFFVKEPTLAGEGVGMKGVEDQSSVAQCAIR
jgi:hypothetical protein